MIRHLWIFALLFAGCGGGMQAINQLPPPAPVLPADASGAYTFTLDSYPGSFCTGYNANGGITIAMNLKQGPWQSGTAQLTGTGQVNGLCWTNGVPSTLNFTSSVTQTGNAKESFAFSLTNGDTNALILMMASPDFSTLAGTWKPGAGISWCTLSGTSGGNWKAVKQ